MIHWTFEQWAVFIISFIATWIILDAAMSWSGSLIW